MQGKTVVVTGAGGGFGRLVAERACVLGARVVGADIDAASLGSTFSALRDQGYEVADLPTDVTDLDQMRALADHAVNTFGSIDVMVNNAGIMPLAFYADHAQAAPAWDRCIDINLKGVLHGIMATYDQMVAQGCGHVINISSIYGNFPTAGAAVYGATKVAVRHLSEALRVEAQGAIKVSVVRPTGVPGTGLGAGVINPEAVVGIFGQNYQAALPKMMDRLGGQLSDDETDPDSPHLLALEPEHLAEAIIWVMNQPWGVCVSDITVRATGEMFVL